ncbi:transcription elongation factor SPT4-like protein [Catenaria anguillulae PL171]|uniref:Transcription elongation factor SPT4 n=1 Tax=Catenaria anguillulae PL171 TaxID=765915 RepID=A0A1Y2I3C1_9FUNG|nr:transcription elongation factor SPT4-like protein [Catenaria anguillulae PL171]
MEPQIPKDKRNLRACLLCSLVKNASQFRRDGCDNCEEILQLRGRPERLEECTTSAFEGTIAMMNPRRSWVGKWQRINPYLPGLYAIKVSGRLPDDVIEVLERSGANTAHAMAPRPPINVSAC